MVKKFLILFIEYLFRKKGIPITILRLGVSLIAGGVQVAVFTINIILENFFPYLELVEFEYSNNYFICLFIGCLLIAVGLSFIYKETSSERKRNKFALYESGLTNTLEDSFLSSLKKQEKSNVPLTRINISKWTKENKVIEPDKALDEIDTGIKRFIDNIQDANNEAKIYYGGLISIPFSFYTGMELDDRVSITVFDYHRIEQKWKEIVSTISDEITISSSNNGHKNHQSIIVIGVSYKINTDEIQDCFGDVPISIISVSEVNINNHWDIGFQNKLQEEFLSLSQELSAYGTRTIHLILAAQNSISFNLGRVYDNRNLPELIVYQYEKGNQANKYPWGVKMKTAGIIKAEIIKNNYSK